MKSSMVRYAITWQMRLKAAEVLRVNTFAPDTDTIPYIRQAEDLPH